MALIKRQPKRKVQPSTLRSKPKWLVRTSTEKDPYIGRGKHRRDKYPTNFIGKTKRAMRRHRING